VKGVRENYYVFLALSGIWMLAVGAIGPHFLGIWVFPLFAVSAVVVAVASYRFRCAYCNHPIVRPRMTVGTTGYTSFPGKTCTNCGKAVSGE
jgi:hypothetical protein